MGKHLTGNVGLYTKQIFRNAVTPLQKRTNCGIPLSRSLKPGSSPYIWRHHNQKFWKQMRNTLGNATPPVHFTDNSVSVNDHGAKFLGRTPFSHTRTLIVSVELTDETDDVQPIQYTHTLAVEKHCFREMIWAPRPIQVYFRWKTQ